MMKAFPALLIVLCTASAPLCGADVQYYPSDVSSWAAPRLAVMKEPSLFRRKAADAREEYRFLWLRTFDKPIAFHIWSDGPGGTMRVIRLSGQGGYDSGRIEFDETSPVAPKDWRRLHDLLAKAAFWQMPTKDPNEEAGTDGSQWILEGAVGGRYHVVDHYTPSSGNYYKCCRFFITLSKQQIPRGKLY